MSDRHMDMGDMRHIQGKLAAKYDTEGEAEVIAWIDNLCGVKLQPGMQKMKEQLSNGQILCQLVQKVYAGTADLPTKAKAKPTIKMNKMEAPFKKMENITNFVAACENYGVDKGNTFQTVDLYEGRNMPQVINCVLALGSEAQRHGFSGMTIGPKPTEKNVREFTEEQLKAGQTMIGLQAGSNKGATQSGMGSGVRHIADIKVDEMCKEGQGTIGLQAGSNKGATQAGMGTGIRHVADIKVGDMDSQSQSVL